MRSNTTFDLKYPRNQIMRAVLRFLGRAIFPILFRMQIHGEENFPKSGPLILVGNHNAAIEGALMALYTPWQVEMLGAGDIPQERITAILETLYQYIPIRRGHMERGALQKALDVLHQGGILGIFPEGGAWNPGQMRHCTYPGNAGGGISLLRITPIWRYLDATTGEQITRRLQTKNAGWM